MKVVLLLLLFCFVLLPFQIQAAEPEEAAVDGAKSHQSFVGDPAQKRGFELGYDHGVKAGKKDQGEGKEQKPTEKEEYKTADKQYRYEYGSRARFVAGYRAGFTKGYKSGYTRAKDIAEGKKGPTETLPSKKKTSVIKKAETPEDMEVEKFPKSSTDLD